MISRSFEPNLLQILFFSVFSMSSIWLMLQYLEERASFFIALPFSSLIWLSTRKRLSKSLKPNLELRLKYFDRLTFAILISHSLPIFLIEHLCIVMIDGPTEKLRGTKYIELSNIQGTFFISASLLLAFLVAAFLHRLDQALQRSKLMS